jgi:RNA ligase (TIGR02306 family)
MPEHPVTVVPVILETHPNANALSIVKIGSGYQACVRTADFAGVDRAAFVEPDSLCDPSKPWFAFLAPKAKPCYGGKARITTVKLRGVQSWGLLVAPPPGATWALGQDVAAELGVTHYDPPEPLSTGGESEKAHPSLASMSKYDVDSWRKHGHLLKPGEMVYVTEKVHGASGRWAFRDGRMWVGSRTEWKKESAENVWWRALRAHPEVERFCRAHPDLVVYGEVYGQVQDLRYGKAKGAVHILVFDLRHGATWLDMAEARTIGVALPWVPILAFPPYNPATIEAYAEGQSQVEGADCIREGCVIKPAIERTHPDLGRVQVKLVGIGYLSRE